MVSTQEAFIATIPVFPCAHAKPSTSSPDSQPAVLDPSSVNTSTSKILQSPSLVKLINKHAQTHSRKLLNGLEYHGKSVKSVSDLIALGANRNVDIITHHMHDETTAFENDVAYYKVLLEARERHREALQNKIHALRTIRAKQSAMYRKRTAAKRHPNTAASTMSRTETNINPGCNHSKRISSDAWPASCGSPVSTDVESDVSSVLDDDVVSVEKPVIYAV